MASGFYLPSDHFVDVDADMVPYGLPVGLVPKFPWMLRSLRLVASWLLIGAMASCSVCAQLGLLLLRTQSLSEVHSSDDAFAKHIGVSVASAVAVEAMEPAFSHVLDRALAWQNHRSRAVHEWHHAIQTFSLLFVNRFFTPGYIALLKPLGTLHLFGSPHPERCRSRAGDPTGECIEELGMQVGHYLLWGTWALCRLVVGVAGG